jgi:hypothetical protein
MSHSSILVASCNVTMKEINHNTPPTVHSLALHDTICLQLLMNASQTEGKLCDNIGNNLSIDEFVRYSGMPIWTPTSCASLRAVGMSYKIKSSLSQAIAFGST